MRLLSTQTATLRAISAGATLRDVASLLGIPYSSAAGRVRKLKSAGLVKATPGGRLVLTDAGLREAIRAGMQANTETIETIADGLDRLQAALGKDGGAS